jgi:hypothetical protein
MQSPYSLLTIRLTWSVVEWIEARVQPREAQ